MKQLMLFTDFISVYFMSYKNIAIDCLQNIDLFSVLKFFRAEVFPC
jgi:hypothetical protein